MSEETEHAEVLRAARDLAYDDYLTSLLAPSDRQPALLAFAALMGELARIPLTVTEAPLGEIRLQWWRDALAANTRSGHPVADAAMKLQPNLPAPLSRLMAPVIEARAAELYAEPFPDEAAFDAYVTAPQSAAFTVRAALLGAPALAADTLVADAARTLGLVRACARLPFLFAKGRYPLPATRLGAAQDEETVAEETLRHAVNGLVSDAATAWTSLRPRLVRISPDMRRVLLPAALAGPYLRAMRGAGRDVLRDVADPSPLERTTRLWLAARLGRF